MLGIAKVKKIQDKDHLAYVRRQSCTECQGAALSRSVVMSMKRRPVSDAHHLKNTRHPRRFFDWLSVPLCRLHHARIDQHGGKAWEEHNWPRLMRVAGSLLYHNGRISSKRFDELIRCGDNEEKIKGWIDSLIEDGQNWDGGTI